MIEDVGEEGEKKITMIITVAMTKRNTRRSVGGEEKRITTKITTTTRMNLEDLAEVPGIAEITVSGEGATAIIDVIEIGGIIIVTTATTGAGITITIEDARATRVGTTAMIAIVVVIATNVHIPATATTTETIIEVVCLLQHFGRP